MNPNIVIAIFLITFVPLIMIRCPITFSVTISAVFTMLYTQVFVMTLVRRMPKQLSSFSLLAVSLSILMGEIMAAGGISSRLLAFANICVRQITGGLVYVNALTSMPFGDTSGSVIVDVSSLDALEIPMMEEAGYEKDSSIAVTMASLCQGLITPPSHSAVLHSMVIGGVSVGSLSCTGYIPGIMLGVLTVTVCYIIPKKRYCPKGKKLLFKEALRATKDVPFVVLVMVIIVGGILAGFLIATESVAVFCIYCLFIGLFIYRELHLKDIPVVLGSTVETLSMVCALIIAAGAFGRVMAYLNVLTLVTNLLLGISDDKIVVLLLTSPILFLLGCVMDLAPLVLIMVSILPPIVTKFRMSPIQSGVTVVPNLGIGLRTPSVGTALFVGCAIGNMKIEKVSKAMLPLYIPILITLLLAVFIPALMMTSSELIMK